jgi:adenylate cyclase class IV
MPSRKKSEGFEELETKFKIDDPRDIERRLREIGAEFVGIMEIFEQRFNPTKQMKRNDVSERVREVRDLMDDTRSLEWMQKIKLPAVEIDGIPRIKHRIEYPYKIKPNGKQTLQSLIETVEGKGLSLRDNFLTERIHYERGTTKFEIDRITKYCGKNTDASPFLEIEGASVEDIVRAAEELGLSVNEMMPITKRKLIKLHQEQEAAA